MSSSRTRAALYWLIERYQLHAGYMGLLDSNSLELDSSIDLLMTSAQPRARDGVSHCTDHREMGPRTRARAPDPGSGSGALARGLIMDPRYDT